jgi:Flp pilus assembly protein TadD/uncharacterized OB-fold protein
MRCGKCGTAIEPTERFCSNCGEPVVVTVPKANSFCMECGCKLAETEKFCSECGSAVEAVEVDPKSTVTAAAVPNVPVNSEPAKPATASKVLSTVATVRPQVVHDEKAPHTGKPSTPKANPPAESVERAKPVSEPNAAPSPKADPKEIERVAPKSTPTPTVSRSSEPSVPSSVEQPKKSSSSSKVVLSVIALAVVGGVAFFAMNGKKSAEPTPATVAQVPPPPVSIAVAPTAPTPAVEKVEQSEKQETVVAGASPVSAAPFQIQKLIDAAVQGKKEEFQSLVQQLQQRSPVPTGDRKTARKFNEEAIAAMKEQNLPLAVELFQKARTADPADVEVGDNLGYAMRLAGRLQESEAQILSVLEQAPSRGEAWFNLGETYSKLGKHSQAVALFVTSFGFARDPKKALDGYLRMVDRSDDELFKTDLRSAIQKVSQPQ